MQVPGEWQALVAAKRSRGKSAAALVHTFRSGASDNSTCVFIDETHPRAYIQNVSVCTGNTLTCLTHVDVLPVHTGRFDCTHGGFYSVPQQTHTPPHTPDPIHHTHHNNTTTQQHTTHTTTHRTHNTHPQTPLEVTFHHEHHLELGELVLQVLGAEQGSPRP